jgi:arginine/lysine/ornithine decarboxylase
MHSIRAQLPRQGDIIVDNQESPLNTAQLGQATGLLATTSCVYALAAVLDHPCAARHYCFRTRMQPVTI